MGGTVSQTTLSFLFAGYAVIWVIIFGYIWFLAGKQRRLEAEVSRLERLMNVGQD